VVEAHARGAQAALGAAGIAVVAASLFPGGDYAASLFVWVAINVLLTASFRFVLLMGELNFAIAGFVGVGAYAAAVATTMYGLPFAASLAIAFVVAGLASAVFGAITLRAKGPYFMLISFAFTEVLRLIYTQIDALGGNSGLVGIFPPEALARFYPTFVVLVVLALVGLLYRLERSDFGKTLEAIRGNDALVQSVGLGVHRIKVLCFVVSSSLAGLAGALLAHANNVISPGDFGFLLAVFTLAYLKVGGERHLLGAVLGAIALTLLAQYALGFGPYEHIFYGAAIVVGVLVLPRGLHGALAAGWSRLFGRAGAGGA
jgi:branched-chain amino acid transport system permease protein